MVLPKNVSDILDCSGNQRENADKYRGQDMSVCMLIQREREMDGACLEIRKSSEYNSGRLCRRRF